MVCPLSSDPPESLVPGRPRAHDCDQPGRAGTRAPGVANQQPWHFVAISDPAMKRSLREAVDVEERDFCQRGARDEWLAALAPLGTDAVKPFLKIAPWPIAVFHERTGPSLTAKAKRHCPHDSAGIACRS
jgi:hypothetical protein